MWAYRFVGQVIVVCCFFLLALAGCAPEIESGDRDRDRDSAFAPTAAVPTTQATTPETGPRPTKQASLAEATPETAAVPPTSGGEMAAVIGDPMAIGRGIRDAAFSPDGETLAIGWTNGVSLVLVCA